MRTQGDRGKSICRLRTGRGVSGSRKKGVEVGGDDGKVIYGLGLERALEIPGRRNNMLECGREFPNDICMLMIPSRGFL
jgi:hypothetical protein